MTNKPYHLMTAAERTAARITKNREIDQNVEVKQAPMKRRQRQAQSIFCDTVGKFLDTVKTRELTDKEFEMALMGLGLMADKVAKVK